MRSDILFKPFQGVYPKIDFMGGVSLKTCCTERPFNLFSSRIIQNRML